MVHACVPSAYSHPSLWCMRCRLFVQLCRPRRPLSDIPAFVSFFSHNAPAYMFTQAILERLSNATTNRGADGTSAGAGASASAGAGAGAGAGDSHGTTSGDTEDVPALFSYKCRRLSQVATATLRVHGAVCLHQPVTCRIWKLACWPTQKGTR